MLKSIGVLFITRLQIVAIYFLIGFLIERLANGGATGSDRNRYYNYWCTLLFQIADVTLGVLSIIAVALLVSHFHGRLNLFHAHPGIPFTILLALLASMVGDFGYYWYHRWQHHSSWLWSIHELHHSDEDVNVTTTFRLHWLESPPRMLLGILPGLFLPNPIAIIPMSYLISCANVFFVHARAPIGLGWANRLINTPRTHRVHHSIKPEHLNKNFAGVWPFWDVLFGTYVHPPDEEVKTGRLDGQTTYCLREAFTGPFASWKRSLRSGPESRL